jgi:hypothetical protein
MVTLFKKAFTMPNASAVTIFGQIDWTHVGVAIKGVPLHRQSWISKHQERCSYEDDLCQLSQIATEAQPHPLQCTDNQLVCQSQGFTIRIPALPKSCINIYSAQLVHSLK